MPQPANTPGTLLAVARRCKVAKSTVSRVLNDARPGRFSVSQELREKILRTARELSYRPSVAARNLTIGKTKLVAVLGLRQILSDTVGPTERAISFLTRALNQAGYDLCVQLFSQRHEPFALPALRVDGVVVAGAESDEHVRAVEQAGTPYVSLNGVVGPHGSLVAPDDAGGTRLALEHLVKLGHRRIAYFDYPAGGPRHPSVAERREAFARLRRALAFEAPTIDLPPVPYDTTWDVLYEPFLRQAVIEGGATAVLAYSHHAAMALVRVAHNLGLSVPRDVSLVCFNDEPVVQVFVPAITAVSVPAEQMGRSAAELLLEQLDGERAAKPRRVKLAESLVVRESTAAPTKTALAARAMRGTSRRNNRSAEADPTSCSHHRQEKHA